MHRGAPGLRVLRGGDDSVPGRARPLQFDSDLLRRRGSGSVTTDSKPELGRRGSSHRTMRAPRTIRPRPRRRLRTPVVFALVGVLLGAVLILQPATPPASAAGLEGPDTVPWVGSYELWCSWSNPSKFNNCTSYHPTPALDVGMPRNTPIYAAGPGIVAGAANGCVETNWNCQGAQGNYVAIKHPNGIYSRYLHLTSSVVAAGQSVARGQLIGYSGATGGVCQPTPCPHLHYDEIDNYQSAHRIDPGPMHASVGNRTLDYPQAFGVGSWNQVPYGTMIQNDGYFTTLPEAPSSAFHPVTPFRALDSRTATGGWGAKLGPGASRPLHVTGANGIPDSASAVVMNVTATNGSAGSFLTVYPAGTPVPTASNLNFAAGQTIPNLVVARIGTEGNVAFFNAAGDTDVIADVVGWFDDGQWGGDTFHGLPPTRTVDSRTGAGGWDDPLGPQESRGFAVRNVGGVPESATSVVMNVTVTNPTANSFVTVYPTASPVPVTSNLNFAKGQTISNLVSTPIGVAGQVSVYNLAGHVDVVVDVVGYFDGSGGSRFHALSPVRILDNRDGTGGYGSAWTQNLARSVSVSGIAGIPGDATSVVLNLTATNGTTGSLLKAYPTGTGLPIASNLLFGPSQTIPNLVMVPVGANGSVNIYNQLGNVDVVADVVGYYASS